MKSPQQHVEDLIASLLLNHAFLFRDIKTAPVVFNYATNEIEVAVTEKHWRSNIRKKKYLENRLVREYDSSFRVEGRTYYLPYSDYYDVANCQYLLYSEADIDFNVAVTPIDSEDEVLVPFKLSDLEYFQIEVANGNAAKEYYDRRHTFYSAKHKTEVVITVKETSEYKNDIQKVYAYDCKLTLKEIKLLIRKNILTDLVNNL